MSPTFTQILRLSDALGASAEFVVRTLGGSSDEVLLSSYLDSLRGQYGKRTAEGAAILLRDPGYVSQVLGVREVCSNRLGKGGV